MTWREALPSTPIVISGVSLLFSAITLWETRLSGARISAVQADRVEFTRNPQSPRAARPAIVVSLLVSNRGARVGYITDVAASVESPTGEITVFRSLYEQLNERLNLSQGAPPPPELAAFKTFAAPPGQTVLKKVFFVLFDEGSDFSFTHGEYAVTVHTREALSSRWRRWPERRVRLDESDINAMQPEVTTMGSGQYVQLKVQIKPTLESEAAIADLARSLRK